MKSIILMAMYCCLSSNIFAQPQWINEIQKDFPIKQFISAVGISEKLKTAQSEAQQGVLSQIKVEINSTFKSEKTEKNSEIEEHTSSTLQTYLAGSLSNVSFVKSEMHENKNYVLAVLDKKKFLRILKSELDNLVDIIELKTVSVNSFISSGKLMNALSEANVTYKLYDAMFNKKLIYDGISDLPYLIKLTSDISEFDQTIVRVLQSVNIKLVEGGSQKAKIGNLLQKPIIINASYSFKNEDVPLKNFSICALDYNMKVLEKSNTDNEGNVSFNIFAFIKSGNKGEARFVPYLYNFPDLFISYLKNLEVSTSYEVVKDLPLEISFKVYDYNNKLVEDLQQKLAQNITKLGHTIREGKSELNLNLQLTIGDIKTVSGVQGDQFLVKVDGIFTLIINSTNENIGSFMSTATGLGNSKEAASKKAYQKIQLSTIDLAKIIDDGRDAIYLSKEKVSNESFNEGLKLYAKGKLAEAINKFIEVAADEERVALSKLKIAEIKLLIQNEVENQFMKELKIKEIELENAKVISQKEIRIAEINAIKDKEIELENTKLISDKEIRVAEINANRDLGISKNKSEEEIARIYSIQEMARYRYYWKVLKNY